MVRASNPVLAALAGVAWKASAADRDGSPQHRPTRSSTIFRAGKTGRPAQLGRL
jgi:hypothetical protein